MPEEIAQQLSDALREGEAPPSVFSAVKHHLYQHLHDMYMNDFSKRWACKPHVTLTSGCQSVTSV
jgi:hypothetical protein